MEDELTGRLPDVSDVTKSYWTPPRMQEGDPPRLACPSVGERERERDTVYVSRACRPRRNAADKTAVSCSISCAADARHALAGFFRGKTFCANSWPAKIEGVPSLAI